VCMEGGVDPVAPRQSGRAGVKRGCCLYRALLGPGLL